MTLHASEQVQYITRNPLIEQRADPWILKANDGYYYFTGSVPAYDLIELRRSSTIAGLSDAEPVMIWQKHERGPMSRHIWAPELHQIGGKWYIYFSAGTEEKPFSIRMYVLENESSNPLEGVWIERGQITTGWDSFSLDATSFVHKGKQYLVWAQQDPAIAGNTNLYIASMRNPWTLESKQVMITKPEYDWETFGYMVNEGPAVIIRNGRVFLTYSGSATDHHYAMGMLTASCDSDLLNAASWSKSPVPVFQSCEANSQYGPGHNSFTVSEDGSIDILVYHARSYKEIIGDSLHDPNRHARVKPFGWRSDGTPDFGIPPADYEG